MTATAQPFTATPPARPFDEGRSRLIERVNRLYHEWTAARFDADHRARHRVEAAFWRSVGESLLRNPSHATSARVVLDIACGSGFVAGQLIPYSTPTDLILGVDLSAASLSSAARKCADRPGPHVRWMAGSGTRLPLYRASVDLVTVNASLHHFAAPEILLREIDRVLRPGGYFAIGFEPNARYFEFAALCRCGAALDRLSWYLSVRQNLRRAGRLLAPGLAHLSPAPHESGAAGGDDHHVASLIARRLVCERFSVEELAPDAVLDLVDPHTRGRDGPSGLHLAELLARNLPRFEMLRVETSDFLGASARRFRPIRAVADAIGRRLAPDRGSLISCMLRKAGPAA